MANNIFTNQLNNRELMDAFGIQQDNAPLTPEQLVALSEEQQQSPVMEEVAEPVQAPIKTATQPTLKKAQVEQSMEPSDSGISKAMDALKNWENRPKEEASSISQTQTTEAPMSKSEALIAEYNKLLGKGQEDLAEARRRDRMLKVGGSLGDALATYLNARSQMNVKAPGVQVQQGAGLGKIADMFATAPEIASDVAQRREAMMKQYAELAKGERSQAKLTSEEKKAKSAQELTKELAEEKNKTMLQAARIKASKKSEEEKQKPTIGEQTVDREFAKKYNEWRTGGKADYEENKKIFDEAISALEKGDISTGTTSGIGSRIPGIRTEARELETRVRKAVNGMLRATLGAQFTEEEGKRIFEQTFDPFASPEENIKNMQTELNRIEKRAVDIEQQGKYFTKQKTVSGFEPEISTTTPTTILRKDPKSGRTVEYDAQTKKPIRFVD
jgi:hypothetical protein